LWVYRRIKAVVVLEGKAKRPHRCCEGNGHAPRGVGVPRGRGLEIFEKTLCFFQRFQSLIPLGGFFAQLSFSQKKAASSRVAGAKPLSDRPFLFVKGSCIKRERRGKASFETPFSLCLFHLSQKKEVSSGFTRATALSPPCRVPRDAVPFLPRSTAAAVKVI
jgi:hypothetical protein